MVVTVRGCGRQRDGRGADQRGGRGLHGGLPRGRGGFRNGYGHGTLRRREVQHLGDLGHLDVVQVIPRALEHALGGHAADVVLEHKLS